MRNTLPENWSAGHYDRPGLAGIALTTHTSVLTAIGNDCAYDQVFARQAAALGKEGDVFVAISTSGCSPNILRAFEESKRLGITTVGFTGCMGGKTTSLCDYYVRIPSVETPKIQEGHIVLGHCMRSSGKSDVSQVSEAII
jgi:D-sedoheptulose 7-phosphate isomerase